MDKLKPDKLRKIKPSKGELKNIKRNPIYLILDEVIDTYNIGSLFRLADAIAAKKMYLCGNMEYPPASRIHKSAVGTENWVTWEKADSALTVIKKLKKQRVQIISVEQHPKAINYSELDKFLKFPCAIVVGNETKGLNSKILSASDMIVELPMYGINNSFNVWGSAAIIAYKVLEEI